MSQLLGTVQRALNGKITAKERGPLVLAVVGLFVLVAPLDVFQLVCALIGAILYAVLYLPSMPSSMRASNAKNQKFKGFYDSPATVSTATPAAAAPSSSRAMSAAAPIKAPTFEASTVDEQIGEFCNRIAPTPSCHRAVEELTAVVRKKIQTLVPEAEVTGFATGDLRGGTAYGVAVPDVDIVVNVSPTDLTTRLQGRLQQMTRQRNVPVSKLDTRKLQKSAIRVCTSLLVSAGFKFRRSCFRSEEPKVTLLAPPSLGASTSAIPVDFSINNSTPLYNMALLTECGQMDPRARSLIFLVKRWAKDRGICHASKGHLPPYAWSLLAIYFLQAGVEEPDGGLPLPPLDAFALSSGLMGQDKAKTKTPTSRPSPTGASKTMGQLFKDFIRFYNKEFSWRNEAVSIRSGKRAAPDLSLDIHIVLKDDGTTAVAPTIEDPFEAKANLGRLVTAGSLERLLQELSRADELLSAGASLTKLLEPWRPPEFEKQNNSEQSDDEHM